MYKYYSSLRRSDQLPSNSDWVEITSRTMVRAALLVVKKIKKKPQTLEKNAMTYLLQPQQITRWAAASLHQSSLTKRAQPKKAQTKINRKKKKENYLRYYPP